MVNFIQKKLSTNKSRKNYYTEVLSKKNFQYVRDLFYITLYDICGAKLMAFVMLKYFVAVIIQSTVGI